MVLDARCRMMVSNPLLEALNTKFETLNKLKSRMTKIPNASKSQRILKIVVLIIRACFGFRISAELMLCGLPPKFRIVLTFVNPPDIFRTVGRLAHEIPPGVKECAGCLHLSDGKSSAPAIAG